MYIQGVLCIHCNTCTGTCTMSIRTFTWIYICTCTWCESSVRYFGTLVLFMCFSLKLQHNRGWVFPFQRTTCWLWSLRKHTYSCVQSCAFYKKCTKTTDYTCTFTLQYYMYCVILLTRRRLSAPPSFLFLQVAISEAHITAPTPDSAAPGKMS